MYSSWDLSNIISYRRYTANYKTTAVFQIANKRFLATKAVKTIKVHGETNNGAYYEVIKFPESQFL